MHLTFHRNKVLNFFCILRKISLTSKYFIFVINNNEGCNSPAYNCLLIYDVAQVNVNIADVSIFGKNSIFTQSNSMRAALEIF